MNEQFIRNAWILGEEGTEKLHRASVLVAGLGGVGGYVCEVLARAGVGRLVIVDHDVIEPTNINRQIIAMHSTLGKKKTVAMKDRIHDIWPSAKVETLDCFLDQATIAALPQDIDYVVDAIDTVKFSLAVYAQIIRGMKVREEVMKRAVTEDFSNATDLADYLVKKGMPFREAHAVSGQAVHDCIEKGIYLKDMSLEDFQKLSPLFGPDIKEAIAPETCVKNRNSFGGTSYAQVALQLPA